MIRKKSKVLSFKEQDEIFHSICNEKFFKELPDYEESLRPTSSTTDQSSLYNYSLSCHWHLAFVDKITDDNVAKLEKSLSSLYISNFYKVYPEYFNFYTLKIIDIKKTFGSIDILIVIDTSEARLRNFL